jgi:hypothetical protein
VSLERLIDPDPTSAVLAMRLLEVLAELRAIKAELREIRAELHRMRLDRGR